MDDHLHTPKEIAVPLLVPAGEDRFGQYKNLGISSISFKISSQESKSFFMVEITLRHKGGPAKHLHNEQDEWFYIVEGEFLIEVGDERFRVKPGDSLFAPRKIPHVWAFTAGTVGRFLASVSPPGKLEAFFIEAAKKNILPGPDQELWRPYGLEWAGTPLKFE